ncbi:MAG: hypothetical protein KDI18_15465 [Gammaproteobacteria bacterium]|nr:hypothetical protein [Gammaproteobacteria bacterium]
MRKGVGIGAALLLLPMAAHAFNSGSTGADGAFNPVTDTELQLPPDGVFNFTSVNIPSLVKVTFKRNATNTPVVILAQGNIVIEGTINLNGKDAAPTGPNGGDGNPADDGLPGEGGPGGFDGGRGGILGSTNSVKGGYGLGPGGGAGGFYQYPYNYAGGNGSYGTGGQYESIRAAAGSVYGNELLRPLIGGSGGGGGPAPGKGGGGGGGAILLAASGEIQLAGALTAHGGNAGSGDGNFPGGGSGSGGAIRLIASHVSGRGSLGAVGGNNNGLGRIRIETETLTGSISSDPSYTYGQPTDLFVPGLPGLAFTSIAGVLVPANPVGRGDVALEAATPNPAEITLQTKGVPLGTVIAVTLTPEFGARTTVDSAPTAGSLDNATTSVNIDIPDGRSVLTATTTFTVLAALGEMFAPYAQGETVEQVRLSAEAGQPSKMFLLTASGREVELPAAALAAGW